MKPDLRSRNTSDMQTQAVRDPVAANSCPVQGSIQGFRYGEAIRCLGKANGRLVLPGCAINTAIELDFVKLLWATRP